MDQLIGFYAAHTFWIWAAIAAALLAIEVATGSGWLLWPAASAAVVAVVGYLIPMDGPVALLVFAVLTIATSLTARRFVPRRMLEGGHDINDNIARVIGHHGKAVGEFSGREGRVFIDGKEWAAELDADAALSAGTDIVVVGVSGARLRVRPSS